MTTNNFLTLSDFRKTLCPAGRELFDVLPQIPSSYRSYDTELSGCESLPEEEAYYEHIKTCERCEKATSPKSPENV